MATCLEKQRQAGKILDDFRSSKEEVERAKQILREPKCYSCRNPLVSHLSLDDILCERKGETTK